MAEIPGGATGLLCEDYKGKETAARPGTTDILVDGIPSSPGLANPNQGIAVFPSVESVQELKVQTNAYSAEFGRSGSGIINMIYKSGTNHTQATLS